MAKQEQVPVDLVPFPDDLLSEDSSFLGDQETKERYEAKSQSFNPRQLWEISEWNLQCLIAQEKAAITRPPAPGLQRKRQSAMIKIEADTKPVITKPAISQKEKKVASDTPISDLFNPYANLPTAYKFDETIDEFLDRLRPSTATLETTHSPWIWVANPYASSYRADVAGFKQLGFNLLEEFGTKRQDLEAQYPDKAPGSIARLLKPVREKLEADIHALAKEKNLTTGKWMLFPNERDIDVIWKKVALGTVENRLGCGAKIATQDDSETKSGRVVIIYSEDFTDLDDVKRVLREIQDLGLGGRDTARPLYYKLDAYTWLDLMHDNEYKLKAIIYNSRDLLKETGKKKRW
jgi:Domain of unknown function (DUF1917)